MTAPDLVTTETGWIVNRNALDHFNTVYARLGDLESTMTQLHKEALARDEFKGYLPPLGHFNDLSNRANRPQVPMPFLAPGEEVASADKYSEPDPVATQPTPATGSAVVSILERVWSMIREQSGKELPEVVIVTGSAYIGPARWGHFRAAGWIGRDEAATDLRLGEMFIAGETLAKGAAHTLETMLHEAAHVLAKVREVKDTSRQGRWHNAAFRGFAEELGLTYEAKTADSKIGFSEVVLTEETKATYATVLAELDRAIHLVIGLPSFAAGDESRGGERIGQHGGRRQRAEGTASTSNVKATCLCDEPRIIRVSKTVLAGAGIRCDDCDSTFRDRSEG